jgi:hypothetical protein
VTATGKLLRLGAAEFDVEDMIGRPDVLDQTNSAATVVNDYVWGTPTPPPTVIPYAWLAPPMRFRADAPINTARVTQYGAGTAIATDATSIANYGLVEEQVTLSTDLPADAQALVNWLVRYYADFRMRCPSITINLNSGALGQVDVWRVLGVRIGDRISIPDAPATWPAGSSTLFVEGVTRVESAAQRTVTWNTSPVIGAAPGQVGPWFRLNSSLLGGSDLVPF